MALAVAAFTFAAGCAGRGTGTGAPVGGLSDSTVTAEAEKVLSEFMTALNTCDLERTMALFSPGATMFFPLPETPRRAESKEEIAAVFRSFYEQARAGKTGPRYMNLVPQDTKVQGSGRGAVVSFQIVSGPVTSRRSIVLQKSGGRWLIIHFHASNVRKD